MTKNTFPLISSNLPSNWLPEQPSSFLGINEYRDTEAQLPYLTFPFSHGPAVLNSITNHLNHF